MSIVSWDYGGYCNLDWLVVPFLRVLRERWVNIHGIVEGLTKMVLPIWENFVGATWIRASNVSSWRKSYQRLLIAKIVTILIILILITVGGTICEILKGM